MTRSLALLVVLTVAACTAPEPRPPADIRFGGEDYWVFRDGPTWRVGRPGDTVLCRKPTERDCYWSLRAKLASEAALDDLD